MNMLKRKYLLGLISLVLLLTLFALIILPVGAQTDEITWYFHLTSQILRNEIRRIRSFWVTRTAGTSILGREDWKYGG